MGVEGLFDAHLCKPFTKPFCNLEQGNAALTDPRLSHGKKRFGRQYLSEDFICGCDGIETKSFTHSHPPPDT